MKYFKSSNSLVAVLVLSVLCNVITLCFWMNERSDALDQIQSDAGSIGFLRAQIDFDRGNRRLLMIEDHPEFVSPGSPIEVNTGRIENGMEIWAIRAYPDKQYLHEFGEYFLLAYNQTMQQSSKEHANPDSPSTRRNSITEQSQ